ncbi:MAG: hypothetical protein E6H09_19205 [Bacteroidetes bacterium]|nr:MAG: hypothetical protein E6H09_19205 [Bacteroidota bacterium]
MIFRSILFVLAWQLVNNNLNAQLTVTTLKLVRDNEESYSFPLVHSLNSRAAQKINYYLQKEMLLNDTILTDTNSVFEKSRFIDGTDSLWQSGLTSMGYEIEVNSPQVFSLSFEFETMGAYPENYTRYYNFHAQTGARLVAKDLFTPGGIVELKKTLKKKRQKRINEWRKEMDTTYNVENDVEYIKETFRECNAEADEDNFIIMKNVIVFAKDYCFPHVARPYDISLDVEFAFRKIERFLSSNGKMLLLQKH